ncbi:hypothetical protein DNU06_12430 [Putridiphycobacter roseus]|uniref:DUF4468 domain-containing protein n=1 Tax=Putridiphycobacter roseus TaxID=2219161 RepID=A0A2W1NBG4_9FLAO|nr:hypothetical protein [Putridiphycobacter roseus]PZE16655.1 hypothetical protein DNU06_12430 [Putridiphycobacter roseus]
MSKLKVTILLFIIGLSWNYANCQTKPCVHLRSGAVVYFEKVIANELSKRIKCVDSNGDKTDYLKIDVESAVVGYTDKPKTLKQVIFVKVNINDKTVSAGNRILKVVIRSGDVSILSYQRSRETGAQHAQKSSTYTTSSYTEFCYIKDGIYHAIPRVMLYKKYSILFDNMKVWFNHCDNVLAILENYSREQKKRLNVYKVLFEIEKIYYDKCYFE